MINSFHEKLQEFKHRTVRIYIESGAPEGFTGLVLSTNAEYMVLISIENDRRYRYTPRTITVVPINKITAISRFGDSFDYLFENESKNGVELPVNGYSPAGLNIGLIIVIALIVLMSLNT